jgi:hypothetical protein
MSERRSEAEERSAMTERRKAIAAASCGGG